MAAVAVLEPSLMQGFQCVMAAAQARMLLLCLLGSTGCSGGQGSSPSLDLIPGIPAEVQRYVSRSELGLLWPLEIGQGTIGCLSGAIVFRGQGIDYALNDAARSRGFRPIDPIWEDRTEGWPSNPLKRISQDMRKRIYAELAACQKAKGTVSACRERVRVKAQLTDAEVDQIFAEGVERRWPPLKPNRKSLDPLLNVGTRPRPPTPRPPSRSRGSAIHISTPRADRRGRRDGLENNLPPILQPST